jgi:hypothetical protein
MYQFMGNVTGMISLGRDWRNALFTLVTMYKVIFIVLVHHDILVSVNNLDKNFKWPKTGLSDLFWKLGPKKSISCGILNSLGMLKVEDRAIRLRMNHDDIMFLGNSPTYLCQQIVLNNNYTRGGIKKNFLIPNTKGK